MFKKTKAFCDSFLEYGLPGFDLAVYKDGECILRHMGGYSDLENGTKINGDERYNIYSCSKPITCTAAMQLWEKGLFSLEDKLSDYMPEFEHMTVKTEGGVKEAENPIRIHHLFEMTAGLTYNTKSDNIKQGLADTDGRLPTRESMKYIAKDPLAFEPGERWNYSLCHDVLAALVEVISGEKFEDYVKKNIFEPLGMTNSTFMLPEEEVEGLAQQYRFENGAPRNVGKHIVTYKIGTEYASGGAGCISTVDDYMKFLEGLRTGKLVKPETLKFMTTDRLTKHQKSTYWVENHGYGLGLRCYQEGGRLHDIGWGGAAGAYLAIDVENGVSLYCAMHLLSSPVQGLRGLLYRFILAELFDQSEFDRLREDLKSLHDYNLTY